MNTELTTKVLPPMGGIGGPEILQGTLGRRAFNAATSLMRRAARSLSRQANCLNCVRSSHSTLVSGRPESPGQATQVGAGGRFFRNAKGKLSPASITSTDVPPKVPPQYFPSPVFRRSVSEGPNAGVTDGRELSRLPMMSSTQTLPAIVLNGASSHVSLSQDYALMDYYYSASPSLATSSADLFAIRRRPSRSGSPSSSSLFPVAQSERSHSSYEPLPLPPLPPRSSPTPTPSPPPLPPVETMPRRPPLSQQQGAASLRQVGSVASLPTEESPYTVLPHQSPAEESPYATLSPRSPKELSDVLSQLMTEESSCAPLVFSGEKPGPVVSTKHHPLLPPKPNLKRDG
jgi:hypothetical protein